MTRYSCDGMLGAFTIHRYAMALEAAGNLTDAEKEYRAALTEFDKALGAQEFLHTLKERALRYCGDDADAVVVDFVKLLPEWLLQVHYNRTVKAIQARDQSTAQIHWRILASVPSLHRRISSDHLFVEHNRLADHFLVETEIVATRESRERFIGAAEFLLRVSPAIQKARVLTMKAYSAVFRKDFEVYINTAKHGKSQANKKWRAHSGSMPIEPDGPRDGPRKVRSRLRRTVRRLNVHLRYLTATAPGHYRHEVARTYVGLSFYYAEIGDIEGALRSARRGFRFNRASEEARHHLGWLRRIRRRGR